jgi:NADH dehydrogenase
MQRSPTACWETMGHLRSSYARSEVKRVVIVGGGFAGLNCAQTLAGHDGLHITLLDKNNYQQFQPLLYQVATGVLSPDNAAFNLRAVLAAHQNVDIKMTEIVSVDLATRTAYSSDGDMYQGDYLVLAAGAQANSSASQVPPGIHAPCTRLWMRSS